VIERIRHKKCRVTIPFRASGSCRTSKGGTTSTSCARRSPTSPPPTSSSTSRNPQAEPRRHTGARIDSRSRSRSSRVRAHEAARSVAMRLGAEALSINCSDGWAARKSRAWNVNREGRGRCHTAERESITALRPRSRDVRPLCGVKVWIFKGEISEHDPMAQTRRCRGRQVRGPAATAAVIGHKTRFEAPSHVATKEDEVPEGAKGPNQRRCGLRARRCHSDMSA